MDIGGTRIWWDRNNMGWEFWTKDPIIFNRRTVR